MDYHLLCIRRGRGSLEDFRRMQGQVQCQARKKQKKFQHAIIAELSSDL
jgi:hypothetical protein